MELSSPSRKVQPGPLCWPSTEGAAWAVLQEQFPVWQAATGHGNNAHKAQQTKETLWGPLAATPPALHVGLELILPGKKQQDQAAARHTDLPELQARQGSKEPLTPPSPRTQRQWRAVCTLGTQSLASGEHSKGQPALEARKSWTQSSPPRQQNPSVLRFGYSQHWCPLSPQLGIWMPAHPYPFCPSLEARHLSSLCPLESPRGEAQEQHRGHGPGRKVHSEKKEKFPLVA